MHMPLHGVIQGLYFCRILADQKRRQIMIDHRLYRMTAFAAGIGVSRPFVSVFKPHRRRDQFEMRVIAVLGVTQDLVKGNGETCGGNMRDFGHGGPPYAVCLPLTVSRVKRAERGTVIVIHKVTENAEFANLVTLYLRP